MVATKKKPVKTAKKKEVKKPKDKLLPKFTLFFFNKPLITAVLWLVLTIFGALSYTTLLKREGFPSVNIPIAVVSGTYFVNDPAKVDSEAAKPIADIALQQEGISTVQTQSSDNFFVITTQYKDGTDAKVAAKELEKQVNESGKLPPNASIQYNVPYFGATGGDVQQIDLAISFYDKNGKATSSELTAKAEEAAKWLQDQNISNVKAVFVKSPFDTVVNPATGQQVEVEKNFDRFGLRHEDQSDFYNSVIIGVTRQDGADVIKLDDQVRQALAKFEEQAQFEGYGAEVSASFAPSIKENISELQRVLIEGLLAVLVVGSIVIAIRASFITVLSMITVLLISLGFIYVVGYSLNVITLFALILGLALIVDDTIIMVEAIDAARRTEKDRRKVISDATRKVSRAMVAATLTACLSFAPLLFTGGVLGSFIKSIPVVIIASLIISLIVALVFIPFFSRFILLGKKQMGKDGVKEVAAGFEAALAAFIAKPIIWARNSKRKLFGVGITAILIGFAFIFAGGTIGKNVVFNIFPPTKDTNGVAVSLQFPPNTSLDEARDITAKADELTSEVIGENFVEASYYSTGSAQSANLTVELTSYNERDISSPDIVKELQAKFDSDFKEAKAVVAQVDLGPPSAAFVVEVDATNREAAFKAANDLAAYMTTVELTRPSGKTARMTNVTVSSPDQYIRSKDKSVVVVNANFDGTDTTTLVTLAQDAINKEFDTKKLASYGLSEGAVAYNLGQESENQDSFRTLVLAFPVLLIVMYLLLAVQFKSFLQPLLIFLAIPFSFFGIMLGLYLTDNAISFFALLGFFALVGLSIKNTILLTDFANQARRSGLGAIDASVAALEERFRPLFATSMTAVVSLIPLALTSPFWQGLSVVLIFGLLSSTFLVVTVFPYYYLGAEYLRLHIRAKDFFIWLTIVAVLIFLLAKIITLSAALLVIPLSIVVIILKRVFHRRIAS